MGKPTTGISSSFSKLCRSGFPSVPASMVGYYTQYPAILQQSLVTLFPFLENLKDHLARGDPSSPFSGAAKALQRVATRNRQPRSRSNNRTKQQQPPASMPQHQKVRWGPQGQMAMQSSSSGPDKAEIARLQAVNANMTGRPGQYASTGMPSAPDPYSGVSLLSSARPRPFY
jgi:hypothetical protein